MIPKASQGFASINMDLQSFGKDSQGLARISKGLTMEQKGTNKGLNRN